MPPGAPPYPLQEEQAMASKANLFVREEYYFHQGGPRLRFTAFVMDVEPLTVEEENKAYLALRDIALIEDQKFRSNPDLFYAPLLSWGYAFKDDPAAPEL